MKSRLTRVFSRYPKRIWLPIFIGGGIVLFYVSIAIFADFVAPYDPLQISYEELKPPSKEHLFGTDKIGRDVLSRVINGTEVSLSVAVISVAIACSIGVPFGVFSGYIGRNLERLLNVPFDSLYAFPAFIIALIVSAILGPSMVNTAIATAVAWIPVYYRVMRSITISVKEHLFVEATRALGASETYIILHHIIPRCFSSMIVLISLGMCNAVLVVSGLGFVGFGIPPPTPEWGTDLSQGRLVLLSGAWWTTFFPGLSITLAVLGFNLLGEGIDAMFAFERREM